MQSRCVTVMRRGHEGGDLGYIEYLMLRSVYEGPCTGRFGVGELA